MDKKDLKKMSTRELLQEARQEALRHSTPGNFSMTDEEERRSKQRQAELLTRPDRFTALD